MNWTRKKAVEPSPEAMEATDPMLRQALGEFRASVNAWSEVELSRPRTVHAAEHGMGRVALGWGVAGVLVAGGLSGAVAVAHYRQQPVSTAAVQVVVHPHAQGAEPAQPKAAEPEEPRATQTHTAGQDEPLLASVDSAVSRTVPSAMDPLVELENESGTGK